MYEQSAYDYDSMIAPVLFCLLSNEDQQEPALLDCLGAFRACQHLLEYWRQAPWKYGGEFSGVSPLAPRTSRHNARARSATRTRVRGRSFGFGPRLVPNHRGRHRLVHGGGAAPWEPGQELAVVNEEGIFALVLELVQFAEQRHAGGAQATEEGPRKHAHFRLGARCGRQLFHDCALRERRIVGHVPRFPKRRGAVVGECDHGARGVGRVREGVQLVSGGEERRRASREQRLHHAFPHHGQGDAGSEKIGGSAQDHRRVARRVVVQHFLRKARPEQGLAAAPPATGRVRHIGPERPLAHLLRAVHVKVVAENERRFVDAAGSQHAVDDGREQFLPPRVVHSDKAEAPIRTREQSRQCFSVRSVDLVRLNEILCRSVTTPRGCINHTP
mmetsp:Transcript_16021/g.32790  ORF Transcript_16021/g.32790 Transcript_16021/m.32790 type:complete len:387 (+) Transcript_16021:72-1232(+)